MTAEEMFRGFQMELHQQDGPQVSDTDDIKYFLNKSQNRFLLDKFSGERTSAEGFEQGQDLVDDLRVFFKKDCRTETIYGLEDARIYDVEVDSSFLPSDYMHLVSPRAEVLFSTSLSGSEREDLQWKIGTGQYDIDDDGNKEDFDKRIPESGASYDRKVVPIRFVQSQSVYEQLNDPFHETTYESPLCDLNKGRLNVYTSTRFIVDAVQFNYIRQPIEICLEDGQGGSNTSELPKALHQEIVDRAVRLFLQFHRSNSNEQT